MQARHKSTRNELDLTQHELSREKSKNVELQTNVATALGSENSAVKRAEEGLSALVDVRSAVKAIDDEHAMLIKAWSVQRKDRIEKFIELTRSGGKNIVIAGV